MFSTPTESNTTQTNRISEFFDELVDVRGAIAAKFFELSGRMDIRELWSRDGMHYFRVNWWKFRSDCSEQCISRSAFVTVVENENGLAVSDLDVEVETV